MEVGLHRFVTPTHTKFKLGDRVVYHAQGECRGIGEIIWPGPLTIREFGAREVTCYRILPLAGQISSWMYINETDIAKVSKSMDLQHALLLPNASFRFVCDCGGVLSAMVEKKGMHTCKTCYKQVSLMNARFLPECPTCVIHYLDATTDPCPNHLIFG